MVSFVVVVVVYFGHANTTWRFLSHCSDNPRSLSHCTIREFFRMHFYVFIIIRKYFTHTKVVKQIPMYPSLSSNEKNHRNS